MSERMDLGALEAYIAHSQRSRAKIQEFLDESLRDICGDKLDDFLASRESAERYLHDPSWRLRWTAIAALEHFWGCNHDLAAACERLAFEDPHQRVRHSALLTLVRCYSGTNDRRIGALLAQIVRDADLSLETRQAAYHGLFRVKGVNPPNRPIPGRYRIPKDIDWAFVDSFLKEGRQHRSRPLEGL